MIRLRLPMLLRRRAGWVASVEFECSSVAECLGELERRYPESGAELKDETGQLLPSVIILVNGVDIRYLQGLNTALRDGDEMSILVPLAGGEG